MAYFTGFIFSTRVMNQHVHRHSCSAAQAFIFFINEKDLRISDRISIMTNLCLYDIRLHSESLRAAGYGLSVCVLCLAVPNRDLSLVRLHDRAFYENVGLDDKDRLMLGVSHSAYPETCRFDLGIGPGNFSWPP